MSYYIVNALEYLRGKWRKMTEKERRKEAWDMDSHRFDGGDPDNEEDDSDSEERQKNDAC